MHLYSQPGACLHFLLSFNCFKNGVVLPRFGRVPRNSHAASADFLFRTGRRDTLVNLVAVFEDDPGRPCFFAFGFGLDLPAGRAIESEIIFKK